MHNMQGCWAMSPNVAGNTYHLVTEESHCGRLQFDISLSYFDYHFLGISVDAILINLNRISWLGGKNVLSSSLLFFDLTPIGFKYTYSGSFKS